MKKKLILLSTAALLVALSIVGGSLAATSAAGQKATSDLSAPTLQVAIGQSSAAELALTDNGAPMPGDSLDAGFLIENTADVPLYARVTVTKYWADETNEKNNSTMDASLIGMTASASGWLQAADILTGTSDETEVYYYALPLQPGESAALDLDLLLDETLGNDYQNSSVVLDATVDAVQYVAGENELNADGILAAFGVAASLNGDGSIQSVTQ